jgi:hypothetical protein
VSPVFVAPHPYLRFDLGLCLPVGGTISSQHSPKYRCCSPITPYRNILFAHVSRTRKTNLRGNRAQTRGRNREIKGERVKNVFLIPMFQRVGSGIAALFKIQM